MLTRKLEPEVMDSDQDASEYNSMDHSEVNRRFVDDLLAFARNCWATHKAIGQADFPSDREFDKTNSFPMGDVLDVGTGTALIPVQLCKQHPFCRVMAVDMAVSMLNLAVYNVEASGLRERIQLSQVDGKEMVFRDQMFDVVMSNSIIHHLPEPITCVEEMVRVVRPKGLIFVRDLMRPDNASNLNDLVETYAGKESQYSKQLFADSLHAALTLEEMRGLVTTCGFPAESVTATSDRHWTWAAVAMVDAK
jgi:ubiquinone/menaquinone biosynthesis C-methylase UbiE